MILKDRGELEKYTLKLESTSKIQNALREAKVVEPFCSYASDFDQDAWLFNCLNGTLDLRTGEFREHRPRDMITQIAPVNYDPTAKCPRFNLFLDQIFNGNEPLIAFLLRAVGMCLTGDVSEQNLFILYGPGGNGKNVFHDTIRAILGDYATEAAPELLIDTGNINHPTEVADLKGRRLVIASETEEGAKLKVQLVKRLTGDATLKARMLYKDFFEFDRTHKLFLVTNNKPVIKEKTNAIWRRIKLIPFAVTIPPSKQDKSLMQKLSSEYSGILNRLVAACLEWQQYGLMEPDDVEIATGDYQQEQDPLVDFFAGCCRFDPFAVTPVSILKEAYENWINKNHCKPISSRRFNEILRANGCRYKTQYYGDCTQKVWLGIDLKSNWVGETT